MKLRAQTKAPIPAATKMDMFVARQIVVALAHVLHSRFLARWLLLLGSRRLLGLLAACAAHLGWAKGREGRQIMGGKEKEGGVSVLWHRA